MKPRAIYVIISYSDSSVYDDIVDLERRAFPLSLASCPVALFQGDISSALPSARPLSQGPMGTCPRFAIFMPPIPMVLQSHTKACRHLEGHARDCFRGAVTQS